MPQETRYSADAEQAVNIGCPEKATNALKILSATFFGTLSMTSSHESDDKRIVFNGWPLRGVVNKRIFYGQADGKG